MFIYDSHMGGLYRLDYELNGDQLYCDTCNDSDTLIGEAENREEAFKLIKDNTCGYYDKQIRELVDEMFPEDELTADVDSKDARKELVRSIYEEFDKSKDRERFIIYMYSKMGFSHKHTLDLVIDSLDNKDLAVLLSKVKGE